MFSLPSEWRPIVQKTSFAGLSIFTRVRDSSRINLIQRLFRYSRAEGTGRGKAKEVSQEPRRAGHVTRATYATHKGERRTVTARFFFIGSRGRGFGPARVAR